MVRNRVRDTLEALHEQGPLATAWLVLKHANTTLGRTPVIGTVVAGVTKGVFGFQQYLDRSFDRRFGTDTADIIQLKDLRIERGSTTLGNWYEPVSENVFLQIMRHVAVDPRRYTCVDLGSGKGRGLVIAAEHGFPRVIGVEFARDLHETALRNIAVYEARVGRPSHVEAVCMDAQEWPVPDGNLFFFLYSPFTGSVMERVVRNIRDAYRASPRPIVIVFYGRNRESIADLDGLGFAKRRHMLRADWTRLRMFPLYVYESKEAAALRGVA
jgi:hypothetical protein